MDTVCVWLMKSGSLPSIDQADQEPLPGANADSALALLTLCPGVRALWDVSVLTVQRVWFVLLTVRPVM